MTGLSPTGRAFVQRYGVLGARATASGLAAAWWHGLTRFAPEVVEVTVPRVSNHRRRPGTKLRRRDLDPHDVVLRDGLRVTALPLTVVEAAVRRGGGAKLLDGALQRHVELAQLWRAHLRNKGRHGSPAARRLLQAAADGARSEAERLLVKLLKDASFTGWKTNYPVGGYKVDAAFTAEKVAIEVDGWAFHSDPDAFQIDRKRQNAISLLGWKVLRFTWLDLTEYPAARDRRDRRSDRTATVSKLANAIQKDTSDTSTNQCHPVSTAIAYVAEAYMPNGNTVGHPNPANRRTMTYASGGIHSVATTQVAIVTPRTPSAIAPGSRAWCRWSPASVAIAAPPIRIQLSGWARSTRRTISSVMNT